MQVSALAEGLGMIAALLTTVAFVPQVLKVYRTKSANDVSFLMFSIFSTGVLLWLVYGLLIASVPIVVANIVTLLLCLAVIVLKLRYRHTPL
jgi:MtN3 and saliva related transmembrane protein